MMCEYPVLSPMQDFKLHLVFLFRLDHAEVKKLLSQSDKN